MSGPRPSSPLPLAARRALWTRLWERLLLPVADDRGLDQTADPSSPCDAGTGRVSADGREA